MAQLLMGIDPGFASVGYSIFDLQAGKVLVAGVWETEKSDKKKQVFASSDNTRRAKELRTYLKALFTEYAPQLCAVCVEAMSFPRNSAAAAKIAMFWGLLISCAEDHELPILESTPKAIKQAVCGDPTATKGSVQGVIGHLYPEVLNLVSHIPVSSLEHPYDAIGSILAQLSSPIVQMAKKLKS